MALGVQGLGDLGETEEGVCPSPLPLLCHSLPFAVRVLPLSLLPTFSRDNRRDSPGGGGTASNDFPRVQNAVSQKTVGWGFE